jgi:hypothetical protein
MVNDANKSAVSFRQWLRKARATEGAAGDLIADLQRDLGECALRGEPEKFPRFRTERGLKRHLLDRRACDSALQSTRPYGADISWNAPRGARRLFSPCTPLENLLKFSGRKRHIIRSASKKGIRPSGAEGKLSDLIEDPAKFGASRKANSSK